jgi:hypothetical protein
MEYGITRRVFGEGLFVPISRERFEATRRAKRNLVIALNIEEKFTILLENYVEFEREMLSATLDNAVFRTTSWSDFIGTIHLFNRRLINLLTVCRLYIDQVQHDLNSMYGEDCEAGQQVRVQRSTEYDARLGYRVMEALRNYVQHRGLPINGAEFWGKWDHDAVPPFAMSGVTPHLDVGRIKEDGGFKAAVLAELEPLGEKLDLKPFVREYLEGIGAVHMLVRAVLAEDLAEWDTLLAGVRPDFLAAGGEDVVRLSVVARENGQPVEEVQIVEDLTSRRSWLRRRTAIATHYSKHFVTNKQR